MNFLKHGYELEVINNLKRKTFGESGQLVVLGYIKDVYPREIAVKCNICAKDPELFGDAVFRTVMNRANKDIAPCGCSTRPLWDEGQYKVLCKRKAESVGFKFCGWAGQFKGQKTFIQLECLSHSNVWSNTNLINFLHTGGGCQTCRYEKIGAKVSVEDSLIVEKFFSTKAFPDGTIFSREKHTKTSAKWDVFCPVCKEDSTALRGNLCRGCLPCKCGRQAQTIAYIHLVFDNDLPIAVKFGVSNNPRRRLLEQDSRSIYKVILHSLWSFPTVASCKKAENICKSLSDQPALLKEEFPNGYTETTNILYLEDIIRIYKEQGAVKQD